MRKVSLGVVVLGLAITIGLALQPKAYAADPLSLQGDIIDNMCANGPKDALADFVKTHTKECALAPHCAASGYSIYADGVLYKFDSASSKKVEEFLKQESSKLQVVVKANKVGEELSLISIENQK